MRRIWELLVDQETAGGRAVTSVVVVVLALLLAGVVGRVVAGRLEDRYARYYARKLVRYAFAVVAVLALAVVWRAFAGRLGVVLGLLAAGIAFAMQEVIGALAGWFNILFGRIFRVGDRIQMGGVRGDVIDVTPLRTKIMEIGAPEEGESWVRGRQHTGRIVAISNKATFTEPVFNYSAIFEFIWEELSVPVAHDEDWRAARDILAEEARRASSTVGAEEAINEMARRYPIARADVEPRVYTRATDNWVELSARFVVPVRSARRAKDEMTERVLARLQEAQIPIASTTAEVTLHD
ncbi:MAG: mechanosensitive ion channel family protein [Acidimicrobiia bacterium]